MNLLLNEFNCDLHKNWLLPNANTSCVLRFDRDGALQDEREKREGKEVQAKREEEHLDKLGVGAHVAKGELRSKERKKEAKPNWSPHCLSEIKLAASPNWSPMGLFEIRVASIQNWSPHGVSEIHLAMPSKLKTKPTPNSAQH